MVNSVYFPTQTALIRGGLVPPENIPLRPNTTYMLDTPLATNAQTLTLKFTNLIMGEIGSVRYNVLPISDEQAGRGELPAVPLIWAFNPAQTLMFMHSFYSFSYLKRASIDDPWPTIDNASEAIGWRTLRDNRAIITPATEITYTFAPNIITQGGTDWSLDITENIPGRQPAELVTRNFPMGAPAPIASDVFPLTFFFGWPTIDGADYGHPIYTTSNLFGKNMPGPNEGLTYTQFSIE